MSSPTMNANANQVTRPRLQIGIAALGSIGILTPFLPFTWSTSPLDAIVEEFSRPKFQFIFIAFPFFLAILILIAHARVIVADRFSKTEAIVAYGASSIMALATLAFTLRIFSASEPTAAGDWGLVALPWITIAFGIALVGWCWRRGASSAISALTALQCAYMANASFCLTVFWPHWQVGAIVTAVTVAAYAAHIALVIASTNKAKALRRHGVNS